jgi:aspartate kinase
MLNVMKFGGTSVGNLERIANVANRVEKAVKKGDNIIVVVSAMSGETNKLVAYAEHFSKNPSLPEMDMLLSSGERVTASLLCIALNEMGISSTAMTGRHAGILTNQKHTAAKIEKIDPLPIQNELKNGKVVVVAGFQGINAQNRVTTLGRGGSDLSAVAIAGALKADLCEIYTDVDGIYTTDPRIEKKAKKLNTISYDEMLELASLGAKVLQSRSVELAKKLNVNLITRSSFNDNEGTLITKEENIMEKPLVSGIALARNQARVSLIGVVDKPGIAAEIFQALADADINIDMIVQTMGHEVTKQNNTTNVAFTIEEIILDKAIVVVKQFQDRNEVSQVEFDKDISKVSIVGVGMRSHTGVASKAFGALAKEDINIMMISTSEIKVSIIILSKYANSAVQTLHSAYKLDH